MPRVLSQETLKSIEKACSRYPNRLAAMLPALHAVQEQLGSVTDDAVLDVAEALDVPATRVREAVTFYTMFYDQPRGRHTIKICRNLSCQLRGADRIITRAQEVLGLKLGETSVDGRVTLDTDECLASCGTAPMLWCRSQADGEESKEFIVENLTEEKLVAFLEGLE